MTAFIVDPAKLSAEGAVVDWVALVRRLGMTNINVENLRPAVQLRWMISADLGLPTEPFQVWSRQHTAQGVVQTLSITQQTLLFLFGFQAVTWPSGSMCSVSAAIQAPTGGSIMAFVGSPSLENVVALQAIPAGSTSINLAAPVIDGLLVSPGVTVTAVQGIATNALSQAAGWTLIETVGLPVVKSDWAAISRQGDPQGLTGSLVDAPAAAKERLTRGAPPIGWGPLLAAGIPAPPWAAPDFGGLIGEVNGDLLHRLRAIAAAFPPGQQAAQQQTIPIPPPQNSSGDSVAADSSDATVSPLSMLLMAASSDPFLSLALGFGTAYASISNFNLAGVRVPDFMITAHWEKGLDGASTPLDYAAIIPAPGAALAPPPPANMVAQTLGVLKPLQADGNWRGSARVAWDRPIHSPLFRSASFAAARVGIAPSEPPATLMSPRPSGGFRPIILNSPDPDDPESWRVNFIDHELPIPANPGNRTMKYGAAVQDIYGQWTPWVSVDESMTQPDLDQVRLASARLTPHAPASGTVCPATLEFDFLWDWSVRTPQRIRFAGRLYAAAEHGSPPPPGLPPGFALSLGDGGAFLDVTFAGDVPTTPGATVIGLDGGGEAQAAFGPAQGAESRRYRITVTGFALDFAAAGHIGLAIWAQAQEKVPPQRVGPWSDNPIVVSASDPRPPVVPVEHVALASLPDAAGEAHARIAWTPQPNAAGYYLYESDETQVLRALGRPEPTPDQTLDDRLKVIKDNFGAIPRRVFTRLNATALQGSSKDVTLPRGSAAIHLYLVIGSSAGQVESEWPTDKNALMAVAAPHIMVPAPPLLEVQRILDTTVAPPAFKARIAITARPGPRVKRIDLHRVRVDDAAKELDTMGPPVARIESSGGGWVVTQASDAQAAGFITEAQGMDALDGSWRRVWYRVAAWTGQDDTRGGLPGRSPASTAAWVVIPPPDPPALSALSFGSGSAPPDVVVQWTSPAPIAKTPLGPHTLSVRAVLPGAPAHFDPSDTVNRLLILDAPLHTLPAAPPAAGSGVWIVGTTSGVTTYRALTRRADLTDAVQFSVRLTDPLGRTGEATALISGGAVNPAPDLSALTLHKILIPPPGRLVLSFTSASPRVAPLDGPYKVRVTGFFNPLPHRPPAVIEMPLDTIPLVPHLGTSVFGLFRQPGAGPATTYVVTTPPQFIRFVVRLTAPDGRFVEQTQVV